MNNFKRLSRREQVLGALLFLVVLPLGLWFLVAVPAQERRARDIGALAAAQVDYVWVLNKHHQFIAIANNDNLPLIAPVGIVELEAELIDSGLRDTVITLEENNNGLVRLQLQSAPFDELGRFLDQVEQSLGYSLTEMRITRGRAPALVDAALGLTPR